MSRFKNLHYRVLNRWPVVLWGLVATVGAYLSWAGNKQREYFGYYDCETTTLSVLERGRVERVAIEIGDEVSTNQTLVQMDTELIDSEISAKTLDIRDQTNERQRERILDLQSIEIRLDEWRIRKREDEAEMAILQEELVRLDTLLSKQLIDRDEYVGVKAKITGLETSLENVPAIIAKLERNFANMKEATSKNTSDSTNDGIHPQLKSLEDRKARHSIQANRSGVVSEIYKRAGEIAGTGEPIVKLLHLDSSKVVGFVTLSSVDTLPIGQSVEVVSTGRNQTSVPGTITSISPTFVDFTKFPGFRQNSSNIGYWFVVELNENQSFHYREPVKIVCESESNIMRWLAWISGN